MGSQKLSPGEKFFNQIAARERIKQFKTRYETAYDQAKMIMNAKNRLSALRELFEEAQKDISEIANLIDYKKTTLRSFITGDNEWEDYQRNPTSPPEDPAKTEEAVKTINNLINDYIAPIKIEIARISLNLEARKRTPEEPIEKQYVALFRDPAKAREVVGLFRSQAYIDTDERWLGKAEDLKGELTVAIEVLRNNNILKKNPRTTQVRIFYKRFKYDGYISVRSFTNVPKNAEVKKEFESLFSELIKKVSI